VFDWRGFTLLDLDGGSLLDLERGTLFIWRGAHWVLFVGRLTIFVCIFSFLAFLSF
jgi:hypothetical protein